MINVDTVKQLVITIDEETGFRLLAVIEQGLEKENEQSVSPSVLGRRSDILGLKNYLRVFLNVPEDPPSGRRW